MKRINVNKVVKWVNIDVNKFVADNTDMSDVDFEDISLGHWEHFG
jgi:hypothetical protein